MVTVRRATEQDVRRIARTSSLAFADDPVMRWLVPDDDEYERDHQVLFGNIARRWLATDSLWCTHDAVAMAGWVPPGRPEVEPEGVVQVEHPDWRLARFAALRDAIGSNTPADPHWYLNMLATHPDWQRQGIGGAMMAVVFEIADADGLACYLETETEVNVAYYGRHGFDVRTEWDVRTDDSDGPHMWGMLRPAR
jgi:ribosomal protein S18 acetylase RimI-like enzyme